MSNWDIDDILKEEWEIGRLLFDSIKKVFCWRLLVFCECSCLTKFEKLLLNHTMYAVLNVHKWRFVCTFTNLLARCLTYNWFITQHYRESLTCSNGKEQLQVSSIRDVIMILSEGTFCHRMRIMYSRACVHGRFPCHGVDGLLRHFILEIWGSKSRLIRTKNKKCIYHLNIYYDLLVRDMFGHICIHIINCPRVFIGGRCVIKVIWHNCIWCGISRDSVSLPCEDGRSDGRAH